MYRTPHENHDGMKMWLGADEADDYLALVKDTTHRIAPSLGLRSSLRRAEIVKVTPADLATGLRDHAPRPRWEEQEVP